MNPLAVSLGPGKSKIRLTFDIAQAIYRMDGVRGFYKGYIASLCTYVPNSALWWAFYHFYQGMVMLDVFSFKLNRKTLISSVLILSSHYDPCGRVHKKALKCRGCVVADYQSFR